MRNETVPFYRQPIPSTFFKLAALALSVTACGDRLTASNLSLRTCKPHASEELARAVGVAAALSPALMLHEQKMLTQDIIILHTRALKDGYKGRINLEAPESHYWNNEIGATAKTLTLAYPDASYWSGFHETNNITFHFTDGRPNISSYTFVCYEPKDIPNGLQKGFHLNKVGEDVFNYTRETVPQT